MTVTAAELSPLLKRLKLGAPVQARGRHPRHPA